MTALGNHTMHPHRRGHVLAILGQPHIHQNDAIERVAGSPWGDTRMGRFAVKRERRGHQCALNQAVADAEIGADVIVEGRVNIVEPAVAHEVRAADKLFFRRSAKHLQRTLKTKLCHRGLRGQRTRDQHRRVDVVALAVAGRILDDRPVLGNAGRLRVVGIGIVFGVDGDDGGA